MNKQTGSVHTLVTIALTVALVGALSYVYWQNFVNNTSNPSNGQSPAQNTATNTESPAPSKDEQSKSATISGKAIYPSDFYPSDYKVCALNPTTKNEIACDTSMAGKAGQSIAIYTVSVAPGTYLVAAKTGNMIGYHDGFMQNNNWNKSGLDLCDTQYNTPIMISITANQTLQGIDAGDFYYVPESCK